MLIRLESIVKSYRIAGTKKNIINGVDLALNAGEIISITGQSGCGKTTLLNLLAGLTFPDSGSIYFRDRQFRHFFDISSARFRNRELGLIGQNYRLILNETVMENVLLPARINGSAGKEVRDYAHEIMGRLRIYKYRKSRAGVLSGGQRQRVAIARALVNKPSVILADEPTANLDRKTSMEIFGLLEDLKEEGKGIVIVTHQDYMLESAEHSYDMENGRLVRIK